MDVHFIHFPVAQIEDWEMRTHPELLYSNLKITSEHKNNIWWNICPHSPSGRTVWSWYICIHISALDLQWPPPGFAAETDTFLINLLFGLFFFFYLFIWFICNFFLFYLIIFIISNSLLYLPKYGIYIIEVNISIMVLSDMNSFYITAPLSIVNYSKHKGPYASRIGCRFASCTSTMSPLWCYSIPKVETTVTNSALYCNVKTWDVCNLSINC